MRPMTWSVVLFLTMGIAPAQGAGEAKAEPVELRVPFVDGDAQNVFRGPGVLSHADRFNRYAVDFSPIDEGHLVVAAAPGQVVYVKEDTEGPTGNVRDNNEVAIRVPGKKRVVVYLHLKKDGALVEVGDFVLPGDPIGLAGNTGNSEDTHLHIDVRAGHRLGPSIPWRFTIFEKEREPKAGDGIRSKNVALRPTLGPWLALERHCVLATKLGRPELVVEDVSTLRSALAAKRLPKPMRSLDGRPDGRELLESVSGRIEVEWKAMAKSLVAKFDSESDPESRLVLAMRVAEVLEGTDDGKRAGAFVKDAERKLRVRSKRRLKADGKPFLALSKAMELEVRISATTLPRYADKKPRSQLRSAFVKAAEALPEPVRSVLDAHRKAILPGERSR